MVDLVTFDTVSRYNAFNNHETLHPLVSIVALSKAHPRRHSRMHMGIYAVLLKDVACGDLRYGRNNYDYQQGTLLFFGPGQIVDIDHEDDVYQPRGYALVFHPDLLRGTLLNQHIHDYTFFTYQVSEALHVSDRERQLVQDSFQKIQYELEQATDKHSKKLIVATIELFLSHCMRFYDRQFIMREEVHQGALARFESLLTAYFLSDKPQTFGLPTVGYCADQLNLSANYFGDLVKKETGKSALEYIQLKLIEVAKEKIFDSTKLVNEIAYELGFKYPQHFTRFFKHHVGQSPHKYRMLS